MIIVNCVNYTKTCSPSQMNQNYYLKKTIGSNSIVNKKKYFKFI